MVANGAPIVYSYHIFVYTLFCLSTSITSNVVIAVVVDMSLLNAVITVSNIVILMSSFLYSRALGCC